MKKMKKLTLTKETIRDLSKPELEEIVGGATICSICHSNEVSCGSCGIESLCIC